MTGMTGACSALDGDIIVGLHDLALELCFSPVINNFQILYFWNTLDKAIYS